MKRTCPGLRVGRAGLALLALAAVQACARYQPEPLSPELSYAALDARTLDDPRLRRLISDLLPERAPSEPWDLPSLTLAALYYHPTIAVAHAKLATAEAGITTAAQLPNPTLNLTPTYHMTITHPSPWTVGGIVDIVLETFGRRSHRVEEATGLAEAARQDLASVAWSVRGRVRSALQALWAAESRKRLLEQRLALQDQLVALLERRLAAGQAAALDVTRERVILNQTRLAQDAASRQITEARADLAAAIGVPEHALAAKAFSFARFDQPATLPSNVTIATLRRQALQSRNDLRALLAEYDAAQAALQLEIARQYPDVMLGPGYTYDQGDSELTLGISVKLPILNQNQGPIAEAMARRREAAARFTASQGRVMGEIDRAAAAYSGAAQTLATADALEAGEERRQEEVERSFRAGAVDRPTLLEAQIERSATESARLDVLVQHREALGLLEDALQQPFFDPVTADFPPAPSANASKP
jgi:outer membrane protein, heavy metal efflux system